VTFGGSHNFANAYAHYCGVHKDAPLTAEDKAKMPAPPPAAAAVVVVDDALPVAKRGRPANPADGAMRKILVKAIVLGRLPLNFPRNAGARYLVEALGKTMPSATSIRRAFMKEQEVLVVQPRRAALTSMLRPLEAVVGGQRMTLLLKLGYSVDGWSSQSKYHFLSAVVSGSRILTVHGTKGGAVVVLQELRPHAIPLSLKEFKLAPGGVYDARTTAKLVEENLAENGITLKDILCDTSDTTAVMPATFGLLKGGGLAAEPEVGGDEGGSTWWACGAHEINSSVKACSKEPLFAGAIAAVQSLTTFIRHSPKRTAPVLEEQRRAGVTRPLGLIAPGDTRFLTSVISASRVVKLWPYLSKVYDKARTVMDSETAKQYEAHVDAVRKFLPTLKGMEPLFRPVVTLSPLLGAADKYTLTLRIPLLLRVVETCKAVIESDSVDGVDGEDIAPVARWYMNETLKRSAPLSWWDIPDFIPEDVEEPTGLDRELRVRMDDLENMARYLSPEDLGRAYSLGMNEVHAEAYAVRLLLNSVVFPPDVQNPVDGTYNLPRVYGAPQPPADAARPPPAAAAAAAAAAPARTGRTGVSPEYTAELTRIAGVKKGVVEPQEAFEKRLVDLKASAKSRFTKVGLAAAAGDAGALPSITALFNSLTVTWREEAAAYKKIRMSKTEEEWEKIMGNTLDKTDTPNIYRFWPEHRAALPLHFIMACMVLAGTRATAIANEAFHSLLAALSRLNRASTMPGNLEALALGNVFLQEAIKLDVNLAAMAKEISQAGFVDEGLLQSYLDGGALNWSAPGDDVGDIALHGTAVGDFDDDDIAPAAPVPAGAGAGAGAGVEDDEVL
jgi:hypothetical protein